MNQFKMLLAAVVMSCTPLVIAAETTDEKAAIDPSISQLLKSRLRGADVGELSTTPVDGIYQTRFGNKFAYLSGNGRYIFVGDMIDLETQVNLTEMSRRGIAKSALDDFAVDDLVIYPATGKTQAVLNVFTDSSCPYCKKLHEEVPELQKAGIEVRYFPFPRGGNQGPGYTQLRQVWCGDDREKTMNIVKGVEVGDLPTGNCDKAKIVDKGYQLGNLVGVSGTPALFTESGYKIEGYVPYARLIPMVLNVVN